MIAGKDLPEASQLFDLAKGAPATGKKRPSASVMPTSKGNRLWGTTLWMALTQAADLVTRSIGSGSPDDPYVSLRIGVAAAVAVFSLTLSPLPRLRSVLVRLGAVAMALLQGQGLLPVVQTAVLDPSLIGVLAPNLAAQAAGIAALVQLFIAARARRP